MDNQKYSLIFLFDGTKHPLEELNNRAQQILAKHLDDIKLELEEIANKRIKLVINGSLENIDACHSILNEYLFDSASSLRLIDEAGDEIRKQAYPILAEIEQKLRAFINDAMTEAYGFNWWDLIPENIKESVDEVEEKNKRNASVHHPLEFTQFNHLLEIVALRYFKWVSVIPQINFSGS